MAAQENRQKLIHLHKSISGAPATSDLHFGEIAVNHSTDKPALYIKNNDGIVEFLPATAVAQISKTYADGLIEALDVSAQTIAFVSNNDNITIYPTITEDDGKITISGEPIVLSKVAKTGKAEDISIDDSGETFTATTVEAALAELADKMSTSTTIDGSGGTFTTSNGIDDTNKVLSVKTKSGDYVTVDSDGVQLDSTKIDSAYSTGTTGNLATVGTVKTAIEDLDVNGFQMLEIIASAQDETTLIVKGIKETDGKIGLDSPTNDYAIIVDGQYNNTTNKIATENTVLAAISGLDVTAITGGTNQTITSISEEDGKISATYSNISISASQVTGLSDLYASKETVDNLISGDTGKSVREIANEELAAQLIPETAQESLDTLEEIAAWIQQHPQDASAMNLKITNLEKSAHTHENKAILDGIDQSAVTAWNAAATNSHTHDNAEVLNGITSQKVSDWDSAATNSHTHSNKALLDTYTQTEANLADAVAKKHEHSNETVLDGITADHVSGWNAASANSHTHSNKALLDTYTQTEADLAVAVGSAHNHTNKTVLDGITADHITGWNAASANSHTHENMEVLTGITSTKVTNWDNAANNSVTAATGDTYVEASVTNNTVNVASTTAATNVFTNAVLGVDTTSSATSANVVVDSTTRKLDFSKLSIDCGEY